MSRTTHSITLGLVGNQASVHIQRWADAMGARGHTIVPIDLSGRGRSPLQKASAFLELRRAMADVAHRPNGLVAVHGIPSGLLSTGMRGIHPIVLHAWGTDVTTEGSGLVSRLRGRQQAALFHGADRLTATSKYLADTVRRRFGAEAVVIPFGIDTNLFRPPGGERRPGAIRIGFAKVRLAEGYGPDLLIEALGRLPSDLAFEAVLAGGDGMKAALEDRVATLGLRDRVRFPGRLSHAEVVSMLADLDVFVMPSRREAWGVAAAEASASGLPVIATRVGGIPEIVVDGETGILVPPDDADALALALARVIADPGLRARLGVAGRRLVVAEYRWDECVDRMEAVYAEVARLAGKN